MVLCQNENRDLSAALLVDGLELGLSCTHFASAYITAAIEEDTHFKHFTSFSQVRVFLVF